MVLVCVAKDCLARLVCGRSTRAVHFTKFHVFRYEQIRPSTQISCHRCIAKIFGLEDSQLRFMEAIEDLCDIATKHVLGITTCSFSTPSSLLQPGTIGIRRNTDRRATMPLPTTVVTDTGTSKFKANLSSS